MKRVLVTGGAGFIGSHLVDRLLEIPGTSVAVADNFDRFYDPARKRANVAHHLANPNFMLFEADIRDNPTLDRIFAEGQFDTVFHLAAKAGVRSSITQARVYESVNVGGTLELLELSQHYGVKRFIFGSSSSVYGPKAAAPFREDAALAPISPYAATKAAGELLAHTYSYLYGLPVMVLRFFTAYGPRQRPDLAIHKFAALIEAGKPIPVYGDGDTQRDYTYVSDIVSGILAAADYNASNFEIINLGESRTVRLDYLITLLEEALGKKAVVERLPAQLGDMPRTHADISKAETLLGYAPTTPIEKGIPIFVEWLRSGGREIAT
jgi:UDP-glucuronate 4-epimerase